MRRLPSATLAALLLCAIPTTAKGIPEYPATAQTAEQPSITDKEENFSAKMIEEYCLGMDQTVAENLDCQEKETRTLFTMGSTHEYHMAEGFGQKILEQVVNEYTKGRMCRNTIVSSSPLCGIKETASVRQTLEITLQEGGHEAAEEMPADGEILVFQAGEDLSDIQDPVMLASAIRFPVPAAMPDRTYVTIVFSRPGKHVESLIELPWTTVCYLMRDGFVNDDAFTDLIFYDPSLVSDGRPLMKPVCGDGEGRFSARWCRSPKVLPPHLRITHPKTYQ